MGWPQSESSLVTGRGFPTYGAQTAGYAEATTLGSRNMKKWGLLAGLLLAGVVQASGTDIRYINTDSANVRASPSGAVVGNLPRSAAVVVHQQSNGWAFVSDDQHDWKWVSSALLCKGARCWERGGSAIVSSAYNVAPRSPAYVAPRRSNYTPSTGSCPCSGSSNCYGPRGGRYCITSGGNKRFR